MCTLITIAYMHSFFYGFTKLCYYDCGYDRPGKWYDRVYFINPDSICPVKLYDA